MKLFFLATFITLGIPNSNSPPAVCLFDGFLEPELVENRTLLGDWKQSMGVIRISMEKGQIYRIKNRNSDFFPSLFMRLVTCESELYGIISSAEVAPSLAVSGFLVVKLVIEDPDKISVFPIVDTKDGYTFVSGGVKCIVIDVKKLEKFLRNAEFVKTPIVYKRDKL